MIRDKKIKKTTKNQEEKIAKEILDVIEKAENLGICVEDAFRRYISTQKF